MAAPVQGGSGNVLNVQGITGNYANIYKALGANSIADNTTGSFYFTAITGSATTFDVEIALASSATPATHANNTGGATFKNNKMTNIANATGGMSPTTSTAYDVNVILNNTANTYQVWYKPQASPTYTQLDGANFAFVSSTAAPISTLNLAIWLNTNQLQLDNFYVDNTGANFTSPVPEPSTAILLGAVSIGGAFLRLRRRQS